MLELCTVEGSQGTPSDAELRRQEEALAIRNLSISTDQRPNSYLSVFDEQQYSVQSKSESVQRLAHIKEALKSAGKPSLERAVVGIVDVLHKTMTEDSYEDLDTNGTVFMLFDILTDDDARLC